MGKSAKKKKTAKPVKVAGDRTKAKTAKAREAALSTSDEGSLSILDGNMKDVIRDAFLRRG